jgi:hypothetical protein
MNPEQSVRESRSASVGSWIPPQSPEFRRHLAAAERNGCAICTCLAGLVHAAPASEAGMPMVNPPAATTTMRQSAQSGSRVGPCATRRFCTLVA